MWHITEHTKMNTFSLYIFNCYDYCCDILLKKKMSAMACNVIKPVSRPQHYYDFDPY